MEEVTPLEDLDISSSTDLFKDLEEKSKDILENIAECKQQIRRVVTRVREVQPPIVNLKLKPRAASKKWMEKHGLPEEPTLQEFLNTLLNLYRDENRLELSTLGIYLRHEEAKLLHLPEGRVDIFELIAALPSVFH